MKTNSSSALPVSVYVLALSAFIFNTSEFLPVALLSDIGSDFAMKNEEVGIIMTIYAWLVAMLSLPMMLLTAAMERKRLLIGVFVLFIFAHGVAFFAGSFAILLVSRVMVAIAHALFWSITASLVVRVAPEGKGTKALGVLATGGAVATVLGLPLGRIVGQFSSWQTAFFGVGIVGVGIVLALYCTLPTLPATQTGNLASLPRILKNRQLLSFYGMILLIVTAHFTAYSYIEPFVLKAGFSPNLTTMVLLLFGVSGIVSSYVFGKFYDRLGKKLMWVAFGVMLGGLSVLWISHTYLPWWVLVAFLWGASANLLALSLQIGLLNAVGDDKDVAMSLFSAIFNVGIGAGAMVGGIVVATLGLSAIGVVGAMGVLMAMGLFWLMSCER